jgi:hypothetical protein
MEIDGTCEFYTAMSVIGLAGPSIRGRNVDLHPTTLCLTDRARLEREASLHETPGCGSASADPTTIHNG